MLQRPGLVKLPKRHCTLLKIFFKFVVSLQVEEDRGAGARENRRRERERSGRIGGWKRYLHVGGKREQNARKATLIVKLVKMRYYYSMVV